MNTTTTTATTTIEISNRYHNECKAEAEEMFNEARALMAKAGTADFESTWNRGLNDAMTAAQDGIGLAQHIANINRRMEANYRDNIPAAALLQNIAGLAAYVVRQRIGASFRGLVVW